MRKPLVAGNWKMNNPTESPRTLLQNILHSAHMLDSILSSSENALPIDIALFPPSVPDFNGAPKMSQPTMKGLIPVRFRLQ